MKKISLIILASYLILVQATCQPHCDLKGTWLIKKGKLISHYQPAAHQYFNSRVTFLNDRLEITSGIFYSILSLDSGDWALGRYPFVYYGDEESYKIKGDSLQIYSKPYNV
jgi:hypothetical protein